MPRGRDGRPWRRAKDHIRRTQSVCWICGRPIDYDLPANHRMGFTVDHVLPLSMNDSLALDYRNLRAAHRACNSRKGSGSAAKARGRTVSTSRDW